MTVVLFAVAAAIGAGGRHLLGEHRPGWSALLIANTIGSLVLGITLAVEPDEQTETIVALGLCGSLTTFSSFARQTLLLGPARGAAYAVATVGLACAAVAGPLAIG